MAKITHPANIMRGSQAIRPIQRSMDYADRMATVSVMERAKAEKAHQMPSVPEAPHVNVPNIEGVRAKSALGGGTAYINSSSKAR